MCLLCIPFNDVIFIINRYYKRRRIEAVGAHFRMVSGGHSRPDCHFDGLVFGDVAESLASTPAT